MIKLSQMSLLKTGVIVPLVLSLLLTLVASEAGVSQIPDECKNAMEEAADAFDVEDYSVVLDKFERCTPYGFEEDQRKRAFGLLALSTEKVFELKQYSQVVSILVKYPPSNIDVDSATRTRLLEIQAVSYLESEQSDENKKKADEIIERLLYSKPDYEPTQDYSQQYTERVEQARKNIEGTRLSPVLGKGRHRRWYMLGAVAIIGGVTAIIASLPDEGDKELPGAPAPPQQPE